MFKKSPLKATRLVKRKRKILAYKIVASVLSVLIFIGLLAWLTQLKSLAITSVEVEGNSGVDTQSITDLVTHDISGSYILLFSRSNTFLYPKSKIHTDLLNTFARLDSVNVHRKGLHTLVISVTERTPTYTWCTGLPDSATTNTCYFMDADGYIFSEAPIFSGHAYFAFYGLVGATPIRSYYLDNNKFHMITDIRTMLDKLSFHPYALVALDGGIYNLYVGDGTKIIFKDTDNITQVENNLNAVLTDPTIFAGHSTSTLEYVDTRFGNKIYYKYIGDNSAKSQN